MACGTKRPSPGRSLCHFQKEKPPATAASPDPATWSILLELGRNAGELAVERAADRIDRRNNHNGNARGDEPVLDRGGTGFVFQKRENLRHVTNSLLLFLRSRRNARIIKKPSDDAVWTSRLYRDFPDAQGKSAKIFTVAT
jgi:hypothetical protein